MGNRFDDVYRWSVETVEALKAGDYSRVIAGNRGNRRINNIPIIDGLTTAGEVEKRKGRRTRRQTPEERARPAAIRRSRLARVPWKQDADLRLTHPQGQLSLILLSSASLNKAVCSAAARSESVVREFPQSTPREVFAE